MGEVGEIFDNAYTDLSKNRKPVSKHEYDELAREQAQLVFTIERELFWKG